MEYKIQLDAYVCVNIIAYCTDFVKEAGRPCEGPYTTQMVAAFVSFCGLRKFPSPDCKEHIAQRRLRDVQCDRRLAEIQHVELPVTSSDGPYYTTERCGENSTVHKLSLAKYQGWLQTKQSGPVTVQINDQVTRTIMENREMFKSLIRGESFIRLIFRGRGVYLHIATSDGVNIPIYECVHSAVNHCVHILQVCSTVCHDVPAYRVRSFRLKKKKNSLYKGFIGDLSRFPSLARDPVRPGAALSPNVLPSSALEISFQAKSLKVRIQRATGRRAKAGKPTLEKHVLNTVVGEACVAVKEILSLDTRRHLQLVINAWSRRMYTSPALSHLHRAGRQLAADEVTIAGYRNNRLATIAPAFISSASKLSNIGTQGREQRNIPEKTRRHDSHMLKSEVTQPGIELGSPRCATHTRTTVKDREDDCVPSCTVPENKAERHAVMANKSATKNYRARTDSIKVAARSSGQSARSEIRAHVSQRSPTIVNHVQYVQIETIFIDITDKPKDTCLPFVTTQLPLQVRDGVTVGCPPVSSNIEMLPKHSVMTTESLCLKYASTAIMRCAGDRRSMLTDNGITRRTGERWVSLYDMQQPRDDGEKLQRQLWQKYRVEGGSYGREDKGLANSAEYILSYEKQTQETRASRILNQALESAAGVGRPKRRTQIPLLGTTNNWTTCPSKTTLPTAAERLAAAFLEEGNCSPPTRANRVQSPSWPLPDFRKWESFRAMPLVGGFPRGSPVSPALAFRRPLHSHLISPLPSLRTSSCPSLSTQQPRNLRSCSI
ncbi:hypothetical protein PR048_031563 [Dryococelus australis]|uniref:Uncharacterized protein n=1 Tax=Dryococelus australis TaxID=614101 RepID=A0ABQ9G5M8_9NEOP|nr:hypothetical protein PR048_031563 [Dryococelus australis]